MAKTWEELSDMERLAYMQEAYSRLGQELKVNGDGIRGRLDREYRKMYEDPEKRMKSRDVIINGMKVGTYSLAVTEAKPEYFTMEFKVTDLEELKENDDFDFRAWIAKWVENNIDALAETYFEETGEIVDGCDYVEVNHPATPMRIGSTKLSIRHADFEKAVQHGLSEAISGFLGDGE